MGEQHRASLVAARELLCRRCQRFWLDLRHPLRCPFCRRKDWDQPTPDERVRLRRPKFDANGYPLYLIAGKWIKAIKVGVGDGGCLVYFQPRKHFRRCATIADFNKVLKDYGYPQLSPRYRSLQRADKLPNARKAV